MSSKNIVSRTLPVSILLFLLVGSASAWEHDQDVNDLVCDSAAQTGGTTVVSDGAGGYYVVWGDSRVEPDYALFGQRLDADGNPLWSANGEMVARSHSQIGSVEVATGDSGDLFVGYATDSKVWVQRMSPAGTRPWIDIRGLEATPGWGTSQGDLALVANGTGVVAGFTDGRNNGTTSTDLYGQYFTISGTRVFGSTGFIIDQSPGMQYNLRAVFSEQDMVMFFWTDGRDFATTQWDIYGQRVNLMDGDWTWGDGGLPICNYAETQNLSDACPDGFGGAFLAWSDYRNEPTGVSDLFGQRIHPSGYGYWYPGVATGGPICVADGSQSDARIAPDGAGGALFVWEDGRIDGYDSVTIYGQYMGASSGAKWSNDIVVFAEGGMHLLDYDAVVSNGENGWFVLCNKGSLQVQKVGRDGTRGWDYPGLPVSNGMYYLSGYDFVADGRGGLIAAWTDARSGRFMTYTQRIDRWGVGGDAGPALTEVVDRPGDQGGEAIVSWNASYLDTYAAPTVGHYSVWMRYAGLDKAAGDLSDKAMSDLSERVGLSITDTRTLAAAGWALAGQQDAFRFPTYAFNAPTYGDATPEGTPLTAYKVLAHEAEGDAFWESGEMEGHSIDNLSPGAPLALTAERFGLAVDLVWTPSGDNDEDLAEYLVYRSATAGFVPGTDSYIGTTADVEYRDETAPPSRVYYRVIGRDIHHNDSDPSNEAEASGVSATGEIAPLVFAIRKVSPNPFNPSTRISWSLDVSGRATLSVFDLSGKRVAVLVDEDLKAGPYTSEWDGRDANGQRVSSGAYFLRLEAEGGVRTQKVLLAK